MSGDTPTAGLTQFDRLLIAEVLERIAQRVRDEQISPPANVHSTPMTTGDILCFADAMRLDYDGDEVNLATTAVAHAGERGES